MRSSPKIVYSVLLFLLATIICSLAFAQSGSRTPKVLWQPDQTAAKNAALKPDIFTSVRTGLPVYPQTNVGREIFSLATEKCLDVASGSMNAGANVNQFRCHEGANQKWLARRTPGNPGYVSFENQNSHLCLDVRIGGPTNGTLQQFTCHNRDNQLFRLEPFGDTVGGVRIVAKHSGHCLDVPSGASQDGLLIQQTPCHSRNNQRWIYAENGPYRFQASATQIGRHTLPLRAGHTYSFSLSSLTGGLPLMHLWSRNERNVTPLGQGLAQMGASTLNYVVPAGAGGTYTLFVHAPHGGTPGKATLTIRQNLVILSQHPNFPIGGTVVDVPNSTGSTPFRYETAALPGGSTDTFILALDDLNRLTGFDDDSGTGPASRINAEPGTSQIVVGTVTGMSGPSVLYANDLYFRDSDRDGLGYALERDLGTCDRKHTQPRCVAVFNPTDTDRDGIEDGVEVLGLEDGALDFPRWGANPLHKDLFIEADWTSEFVFTPLNLDRIRRMQFHLAHGPAAHLDNPDGINGIALHVDAGIDPTDPADRSLYGAWGGANMVPLAVWQATPKGSAPAGTFDPRRLRYFRQVLLVQAGAQAGFGRFWFATGTDPDTIMHEFGHTVGLHHEAVVKGPTGPVVSSLNCSPAYPSIMSYATPHSTFLTGEGFPREGVNPSRLCEADGLGVEVPDLSFITQSLGGIPVDSPRRYIDWNRDGIFSGTAPTGGTSRCRPGEFIRAVVNWGSGGCDAHIQGGFPLSPELASPGRLDGGHLLGAPAMTRVRSHLYVFYVKRNAFGTQRLFYQSAAIGPKSTAGCTDGFKVYRNGQVDPCMRFAGPVAIALRGFPAAPIVPSRVAVFSSGDNLHVAVVDASDQIRTFTISAVDLEAGRASQTSFPDSALRDSSGSVVHTSSDLSFAVIGLDRTIYPGSGHHLALYYVDRRGAVRWASKEHGPAGAFVDRGAVLDGSGAPLLTAVGDSPAFASWFALGSLEDLDLYMVLQRENARFRLYRYDRARDRWSDITQSAFNQESVGGAGHNQKIAFWFQHSLDGNGEIIQRGSGFFSILFRQDDGSTADPTPSTPRMFRSGNVSPKLPPRQSLRFPVFQNFGHYWYAIRGNNYKLGFGGGFAVYSDETMPGLKAVLLKKVDEKPQHDLQFLPLADGIFDLAFKPSEDFKVMEATLCRSMRGDAFCGNPTQTRWGY